MGKSRSHTSQVAGNYQTTHLNQALTWRGGATLGALNHGVDKLRLQEAFAEYIIARVKDLDI